MNNLQYSYDSYNPQNSILHNLNTNIGPNPIIIVVILIVIIGYYTLFSSLGSGNLTDEGNGGKGLVIFEIILWGIFIILILLNGMAYIFNFNIMASLKNLFSSVPQVDISVNHPSSSPLPPFANIPEISSSEQVFHVPGNDYTYDNSKAICTAYGGRLATYKEIESAYNDGADWCSFGWSDGQMALYPTQMDKWKKLQKIEGHEHDCGRPGINGGFIDNPNVKFGINCFGYKPKITPDEVQQMGQNSLYPKTMKEINFDKKVDYWRNKLSEIMIAPFNHNNWSII
jgi:hypothetical protein